MNFGFHARWMRADGAGGVYIGDGFRILRFDSAGGTEDIRMPRGLSGRTDSLVDAVLTGPDGRLWLWDRKTRLFRHSKGKEWEATVLPHPGEGPAEYRLSWTEDGAPRFLCFRPDSADQPRDVLAATVSWPAVSPWEPAGLADTAALRPAPAPRQPYLDLWAVSHEGGDTLGLFLASAQPERWRRTVFTVGPLSGPPDRRDTLPFPADWTGPDQGRRPVRFNRESAFLVSRPEGTWIALGGLLARRRGSSWSVFYSQDQSLAYLKGTGYVDKSALSYRLTRPLPYLYTAFLAASAMRTGPGWTGESAWALGGISLGALLGAGAGCLYGGMCAAPNASCGSGMAILYPLIAVPLVMGIWALESHVSAEHGDRKWARRGAAGLGALSGAALYFAFPTESGWVITGALAGASFGAVAGYRLAWLP